MRGLSFELSDYQWIPLWEVEVMLKGVVVCGISSLLMTREVISLMIVEIMVFPALNVLEVMILELMIFVVLYVFGYPHLPMMIIQGHGIMTIWFSDDLSKGTYIVPLESGFIFDK